MDGYIEYATIDDVEEFTGRETLPAETEILIQRASDLVTYFCSHNLNSSNTDHMRAAKMSVCAQVQKWLDDGTDAMHADKVSSYSLGELSINFAQSDLKNNQMCDMAKLYLRMQGLMYLGV